MILKLLSTIYPQQTSQEKEILKIFKPSKKSTDNLNHDDKYNLLQFFNLLIEIDQRNHINAYHDSPSQKGGETNVI